MVDCILGSQFLKFSYLKKLQEKTDNKRKNTGKFTDFGYLSFIKEENS